MHTTPIVLLAKQDRFSTDAVRIAQRGFGNRLQAFQGRGGDPFPVSPDIGPIAGLISFLSPWIVPAWALKKSGFAINFHPASRDYPGTGCYNFAIYEQAAEYGAVCHHMEVSVDTGTLVAETRFPVHADETVETLKLRTMIAMRALFADIVDTLAAGRPLPEADVTWSRRPFVRKELDALCILEPEMDTAERALRIRATTYPGYPGPLERQPDGTLKPLPVPERSPIA